MTTQRTVFQRVDGKWVNKLRGEDLASTVSDTRNGAVADARRMLRNGGGGSLTVFDEDGQLVSEESIAPDLWIDMTAPSAIAELLLRIDGYIALVNERDYRTVLWDTAGGRWLDRIAVDDIPRASLRDAQRHVDAAHAALLDGNAALATDALHQARQAITRPSP